MATIERGEFYMIAKGVRKGFEVTALKLAGMVKIYATKDVRVYTSEDIRGWISDGQMMVRRDVVKLVTGANRVLHHVFEGGDGNPFRVEPVLRDTDTVKAPIKRAKGTEQCAVFVTQSGVRIGIAKEYISLLSLGEAKADYMDPARKMVTVTKNGEIIAVVMPMILEEANVKPEPDTAVPLPPATEAKYRSYARRKGTPNETTAQYVAQVRADLRRMIESGAGVEEVEDAYTDAFGVEPDGVLEFVS